MSTATASEEQTRILRALASGFVLIVDDATGRWRLANPEAVARPRSLEDEPVRAVTVGILLEHGWIAESRLRKREVHVLTPAGRAAIRA